MRESDVKREIERMTDNRKEAKIYNSPYPILQKQVIKYYEAVHVYEKNNNPVKNIDFKEVMEMRKGKKGLFDE